MSLEHMISSEHELYNFSASGDQNNHMQTFGPVTQCNPFFTGYIDCAQEALWYLTQVEKLPFDHPMVMGLQMHLWEQYKMLQIQQMLRNNLSMCGKNEPVIGEAHANIKQINVAVKDNKELTSAIELKCEDISGKSAIRTDVVKAKDKELPQTELRDDKHADNADQNDSELSPEAQKVAEALAEEIFSILNAENDLDDYNYSDEDGGDESESIDEGFEEMEES